jgi:hypothetical protein
MIIGDDHWRCSLKQISETDIDARKGVQGVDRYCTECDITGLVRTSEVELKLDER